MTKDTLEKVAKGLGSEVRSMMGNHILTHGNLKIVSLKETGAIALYYKGQRRLITNDAEVLSEAIRILLKEASR